MTKSEILNEIKKNKLAIAETLDAIANEKRELSNVEKINVESAKAEIAELEIRMKTVVAPSLEVATTKATEFNILRSISDFVNGNKFDDATQELINKGKEEFRSAGLSATGQITLPTNYRAVLNTNKTGEGQELVGEDKWATVGALRNQLVFSKLGAKIVTGLVGDVSIPKYSGSNVGWALETADGADGAGATSELTMSPKKLTAFIDVSKMLLNQTSFDAQQMLIEDLNNAIAAKLEASIIDATAASATRPAGLFNGVVTTSVATTNNLIVGMEGDVETSNALTGSLGYLTTPSLKSVMKTTAVLTNGAAIMVGKEVNGYNCEVSSAVPTSGVGKGIIFGNWNDLVIAQWGNTDITIDPYSQAIGGKVRLVVNTYWNWTKVRNESFTAKYLV